MRPTRLLFFIILGYSVSVASAQLRIVSYNVATSGQSAPNTPRSGMDVVLEAIGNEARVGISKPIDVLVLQETQSSSVTSQAFVNLLNGIYGGTNYTRATINPGTTGAGRVGLVFNSDAVQLISQTSFGNASPRDTGRYQLRPVGYGADADFYIYNDHYKAGSQSSDQTTRNSHAFTVKNNANALGPGANIIYAGDFNIQSSSEAMYQTLLGPGNGQAFDPINSPGNWNNSSSFRSLHTQSPYDTSFNDPTLIGGGLDDRFDFQLVSGEMNDSEGLAYIGGSYRAFGNNGSHGLNDAVNDPSNNAQPANVLDALASVSDHLPVVADYQLPAVMQIAGDTSAGRAILGSVAGVDVNVWNAANVVSANGADELDYTVMGINGLSGSVSDSDNALGAMNSHTLLLDTSNYGMQMGTVQATTSSEQALNPQLSYNVNFEIVDHSNASLDGVMDTNTAFIDLGIVAPNSVAETEFAIFNLVSANPTAALDLLSVTGSFDTDKISLDLMPFANLEAGDSFPFNAAIDTSESGMFAASYSLLMADEDIPGRLSSEQLSLSLLAKVTLPGDANLDGTVDGSDFIIWNNNKFTAGTDFESGDFNGDGVTDGSDFIVWNNFKFMSLDFATVPEPTLVLLPLLATLGLLRRRI